MQTAMTVDAIYVHKPVSPTTHMYHTHSYGLIEPNAPNDDQ